MLGGLKLYKGYTCTEESLRPHGQDHSPRTLNHVRHEIMQRMREAPAIRGYS